MPVPSLPIFGRLYRLLATRRRLLLATTVGLVLVAAAASWTMRVQEDIEAMLPDDSSSVAEDFRLLQLAPFTRKVVISLKMGTATDAAVLTATADKLAAALASPLITRVTTGPADQAGTSLLPWLSRALPSLATPADLESLRGSTKPEEVRGRLQLSYEQLLAPEGWALKGMIQDDPLAFYNLALEKMRFINMIPNMRLVNGHFVSADGTSALLVADTGVSMTDSAGARKLMNHITAQVAATVPAGIKASVVCGHRYTLANADAVKHDLTFILIFNSLAVLAIYIIFLRSMNSIFVFLVPTVVLVIASGVIALVDRQVFAVTLGFGGVLLGIADEYAMLVYFSCRRRIGDVADVVAEVSRPVLLGATATLMSFAVMFMSSLPGQRQLALYTMTGIAASLVVSLVILPHLIKPKNGTAQTEPQALPPALPPRRLWLVAVWVMILLLCGWQATKLRFNGELRSLSLVPAELKAAEEELTATWGDLRGKAILFTEGKDLESALVANDALFTRLVGKIPAGELVSLAPLLPAAATQEKNRARWQQLWQETEAKKLADTLRREGSRFGFSAGAFTPFLARLTGAPGKADPEALKGAGLGELVDSMIVRSSDKVRVMTMVPDRPEIVAAVSRELKDLPQVRLVSQSRFGDGISRAIATDFSRYMTITSVIVLTLVIAVFRRPGKILLVLVPVITGLACMLGIMGMCGIEFNLFNIVATILIIGLCVDYGIFMVCKLSDGSSHAADRAVLVSGLTTLAGFGSLAFARHPSMYSIGVTVLLGIGSGIPAALLIIPQLYGWQARRSPVAAAQAAGTEV